MEVNKIYRIMMMMKYVENVEISSHLDMMAQICNGLDAVEYNAENGSILSVFKIWISKIMIKWSIMMKSGFVKIVKKNDYIWYFILLLFSLSNKCISLF